jgi:hypothetical protein
LCGAAEAEAGGGAAVAAAVGRGGRGHLFSAKQQLAACSDKRIQVEH